MNLNLVSDKKSGRVAIITSAYWAIAEILAESKQATLNALTMSYRMHEPDKNRERLAAQLVVLEDLESVFKGHLPPSERSPR